METASAVAGTEEKERFDSIEGLVSSYDFNVPFSSAVSQEAHVLRGRRIYSWLIRKNVVSLGELKQIRRRELNYSEFQAIQSTPEDYWLIATSQGMNFEQHERFVPLVFQSGFCYKNYLLQQSVWQLTAFDYFKESNGRFPNNEEELEIINKLAGPYRAYWVLKRDVFGEEVSYSRAQESWDRIRRIQKERNESNPNWHGLVTAWQMQA